jgi:hypothetical protein
MADNTGVAERAFILSPEALGALAGGRVYKTQAPDSSKLARKDDDTVKPYLVVTFQTPSAAAGGRSIGVNESRQPHLMGITVAAYAGDAESAEALMAAVIRTLVGTNPSDTAGEIKLAAGQSFTAADNGSRPTRFGEWAIFKVYINLGI